MVINLFFIIYCMDHKPSVGRIVHYVGNRDGLHMAALITAVNIDGSINIDIFGPDGGFGFRFGVFNDEGSENVSKSFGTWHWPERV